MIRVLVVDDSPVDQMLIAGILSEDPDILIVGRAGDGAQAIQSVQHLKPDIVTMDVNMPGIDGFATTRKIMESTPVPIIIVSSIATIEDVASSFRAIEAGALHVMRKPPGPGSHLYAQLSREFLDAVRIYSEVRVVRRLGVHTVPGEEITPPPCLNNLPKKQTVQMILIGASTGGPPVIQEILLGLPPDFPVPILIVQHMSTGFVEGFASWLVSTTGKNVSIASDYDSIRPGQIYIAPSGSHMGVRREMMIHLSSDPPEQGIRPAVGFLFRSAAEFYPDSTIAVLLTGMGSDGASDLLTLYRKGALTIAQDQTSSIVYGMPGSAVQLGAATCILAPDKIVELLAGYGTAEKRPG